MILGVARKPRGFQAWDVPVGRLLVRMKEDGRWVILASEPDVKIDNMHRDGRAHIHIGGWDSDVRRELRVGLTAQEAAETVARHLTQEGHIDVQRLGAELA